MTPADLNYFKQWFSDYCCTYYDVNPEHQRNIVLKEHHTRQVCENILRIAQGVTEDLNSILVAETVALFHDLGRFPQYAQYRTFIDARSLNHALLGSTILQEQKVLQRLDAREQRLVVDVVKFHNAFAVPRLEDEETLFHLRMIRDADKLDIWRVFIEYYATPPELRPTAAGLGLPDTPECSSEVVACLREHRIAPLSIARCENDYKLLQLSWVFDISYVSSLIIMTEHDCLGRMLATLPATEEIREVGSLLRSHIADRISRGA